MFLLERVLKPISEWQTYDYVSYIECENSSLDFNLTNKEPLSEFLEKNKTANVYDKLLLQETRVL